MAKTPSVSETISGLLIPVGSALIDDMEILGGRFIFPTDTSAGFLGATVTSTGLALVAAGGVISRGADSAGGWICCGGVVIDAVCDSPCPGCLLVTVSAASSGFSGAFSAVSTFFLSVVS